MKAYNSRRMMCNRDASIVKWVIMSIVVYTLMACTPVKQYAITMTSDPVRNVSPAGEQIKGIVLTVAEFIDVRATNDTKQIGRVIESDGESIPVISVSINPADAVTSAVKSYLKRAGYTLSKVTPAWDLKPDTIPKRWGQFLVGGKIDEMEIVCEKTSMKANYRTRVVLSMYLVDIQSASVIHSYTVQDESKREDVNLTEDDLRKHLTIEVNNAVTDAIEKLLDPKNINVQILKSAAGNKP